MPNQTTIKNMGPQVSNKTPNISELAQVGEAIVSHLSSVLNHKITLTDANGNIVADSDMANFDKFVPSAVKAIQSNALSPLSAGEIDEMSGWVTPLHHQGKLLGTLALRNEPTPEQNIMNVASSLSELLMYQTLVMDKVAQQNRVLDKFFYDLLEQNEQHEKLLRDSVFFNSQFFQIDFNDYERVGVLLLTNFWNEVIKNNAILPADEHKLTNIKDQISQTIEKELKLKKVIIAYLGGDEFSVLLPKQDLPARSKLNSFVDQLKNNLNRECHLAIGTKFNKLSEINRSYQGAKKAVRLGSKLFPDSNLYFFEDLLLPIMLEDADENLKRQFIDHELGDLIEQDELMETLTMYFDCNLNLKKTAHELGIHKNTLYYRLDKIKNILNVDPQEFKEALKLKMAINLYSLDKIESSH